MNTPTSRFSLLAAGVAAAISLAACGGGGGDGDTDSAGTTQLLGGLRVALTNSQACGFDSINLTVSKVRVHQSATAAASDSGWSEIVLAPARKINLLAVSNGVRDVLGQASLPAGHYSQMRVVLSANTATGLENSVKPTGGTEVLLDTAAAPADGIKLASEFDVASGVADVVIDADACKSVIAKGAGQYALNPFMKAGPATYNGIIGNMSTGLSGSKVVVSAQQNGVIVRSTTPVSNIFVLDNLAPGNYDVVFTADGRGAAVIGAVPVASTSSVITLSNATTPVVLATSTTRNIGGVVTRTPANTTSPAYVSAKQSIINGPTVTLKTMATDLAAGAYTIANLPILAPQYMPYTATLAPVFTSQPSVLPGVAKYLVEATAAGYTTKSIASVDITTASQTTANIALVP
ncbi:MAG: DUF4382 domain-containing protein [Massilia sp.]